MCCMQMCIVTSVSRPILCRGSGVGRECTRCAPSLLAFCSRVTLHQLLNASVFSNLPLPRLACSGELVHFPLLHRNGILTLRVEVLPLRFESGLAADLSSCSLLLSSWSQLRTFLPKQFEPCQGLEPHPSNNFLFLNPRVASMDTVSRNTPFFFTLLRPPVLFQPLLFFSL